MTNRIASDLLYEFDWLVGAANKDPASSLYRKVDGDHIGLAGHSYGGQAALLAGEHLHKRIKGVFGLDPVDLPLGPQARDNLASIGVPVVFLGETTDSSFASCAPSWSNYQMLYRYAASGAVMITAVGADHTMFEDPANCSLCWLCLRGRRMGLRSSRTRSGISRHSSRASSSKTGASAASSKGPARPRMSTPGESRSP